MADRPPWQWVALGVLVTVLVLGYVGQLTSCGPVDRTLNPDARNWWESEQEYVNKIIEYCAQYVTQEEDSKRVADRCVASSIDEAVERGYISRGWK